MSLVAIQFNSALDVLSATLRTASVVRARPSRTDTHLVFKLDRSGRVVGIDLLGPTEMRPAQWREHPDRQELPAALLAEVDAWLDDLWSHLSARAR